MRWIAFCTIVLVLIVPAFSLSGYCTGQYVETGDKFIQGYIHDGDVFEYWCELPEAVSGHGTIEVRMQFTNAEIYQQFLAPRIIYGTTLVIYP